MERPQPYPTLRAQGLDIFLVSLALMMFEVNLVRLFSVVMQNHLAFFVLAIALFGIGLGGLYAYVLRRQAASRGRRVAWTPYLPILLSLSVLGALFLLMMLPADNISGRGAAMNLRWVFRTFLGASAPFFFGSMYVSQIFASRPRDAGWLYFSDLVGAGAGCLLAAPALQWLGGLTAPFLAAGLVVIPAFRAWGSDARARRVLAGSVLCGVLVLGIANEATDFVSTWGNPSLFGKDLLFAKWNTYSRIAVHPPKLWRGWRLSRNYTGSIPEHLEVSQDGRAPTHIVRFDGDYQTLQYLRYDVTSLPYRLALNPMATLIIGVGGGCDILTAKLYGVPKIDGAELNAIIAKDVMRGAFRDYSGNVYGLDGVDVSVANGRTFAARTLNRYDIIFLSFADSQSGNNEGASIVSENHLYTAEAYETYWSRLSANGLCAISGATLWGDFWLYRVVNTMREALVRQGVKDPARHMLVIVTPWAGKSSRGMFTAFFREPVDPGMVGRAVGACRDLGYVLAWPPEGDPNPWSDDLARVFDDAARPGLLAESAYDLSPVVDDRPYLWFPIKPDRFMDLLLNLHGYRERLPEQIRELHVMVGLFIGALTYVFFLMILPLVAFRRDELGRERSGRPAILAVFLLLGVAYVMIEIALLEHCFLFLGDPTLAFAVILAAMLTSSGVGSFLSRRFAVEDLKRRIGIVAVVVVAVQAGLYFLLPAVVRVFLPAGMGTKTLVAVGLVAVVATPMGMLFPSAIRWLDHRKVDMTCWVWGMNGVGSVLGSVGATILSLNFGIHVVFLTGMACYALVGGASCFLKGPAGR